MVVAYILCLIAVLGELDAKKPCLELNKARSLHTSMRELCVLETRNCADQAVVLSFACSRGQIAKTIFALRSRVFVPEHKVGYDLLLRKKYEKKAWTPTRVKYRHPRAKDLSETRVKGPHQRAKALAENGARLGFHDNGPAYGPEKIVELNDDFVLEEYQNGMPMIWFVEDSRALAFIASYFQRLAMILNILPNKDIPLLIVFDSSSQDSVFNDDLSSSARSAKDESTFEILQRYFTLVADEDLQLALIKQYEKNMELLFRVEGSSFEMTFDSYGQAFMSKIYGFFKNLGLSETVMATSSLTMLSLFKMISNQLEREGGGSGDNPVLGWGARVRNFLNIPRPGQENFQNIGEPSPKAKTRGVTRVKEQERTDSGLMVDIPSNDEGGVESERPRLTRHVRSHPSGGFRTDS